MIAALESVSVNFGEVNIFSGVSARVNAGNKIGLIGANGAGKTTLLKTLVREIPCEAGQVIHGADIVIGYLHQNSGLRSGNTLIEEMRRAFDKVTAAGERLRVLEAQMQENPQDEGLHREYDRVLAYFEAHDGYQIEVQIRKVLFGMGFAETSYEQCVDVLSGGEKTRLAIAKLLLEKPELLILDEPTNHLDFKTLLWLEDYLRGYAGAVLIVSHDRYFLDRLTDHIWELEDGRLWEYKGNYSQYKQLKSERVAFQKKEYEKQARQIEHLQDYVMRNMARASTAASARSREKQLERMELIEKPREYTRPPSFSFRFERKSVQDVLTVAHLDLSVEQKTLAQDVNFVCRRGEKMALIGANGTGKSTLMKRLLRASQMDDVSAVWGKNTLIGYYDQENKNLDPEKTVLDELWDRFPSLAEYEARGMLGRVLLMGEDVYKQVKMLSGGERAKVGFAILMCGEHNVLLLDEPTNHLDLPSRESLEQALMEYEGTLLFVSHDRYFVNALADKVLEIEEGSLKEYLGNFDAYTQQKEAQAAAMTERTEQSNAPKEHSRKQKRAQDAQRRQRLSELMREIERLEAEEKRLLAEAQECAADYARVTACYAELERVKQAHEALSEEWLELSEE